MIVSPTPRAAAFAAACVVLVAIAAWQLRARDAAPTETSLPSPEALDSLEPYLKPVAAAPRLDDYTAFVPAAAPPTPVGAPLSPPAAPAPRVDWRVSAILVAGGRPTAILNDESVGVGARLADGTRVEAILQDRVIIRAPDGTRRTLWLSAG